MKDTNLIIGKKNTGKTKNILFNEFDNSIKNNENLLIYNDRDEYYQKFSKKLMENDYHILILNLKDTTKTNGYNPLLEPYLLYKEKRLDDAVNLVNNLALEIFKENGFNHDPFWENMAANYFTGLTLILFKEASLEEINLGSIQVMMMQGESKYGNITYLKKYLENIDVTNSIYSLLSPIVFAPADTKGSILSVAKQKLNRYLLRDQLLNLLNTNEISLRELNNKTAIFIIGKEEINDIANILIDQLINIVHVPFTFILDNFDSLRKVLSLKELIRHASYCKNKVYIAVHNEEEFKDIYGKFIIDQFENIIYAESNFNLLNTVENKDSINNNIEYPLLDMQNHFYLDFKKVVEREEN